MLTAWRASLLVFFLKTPLHIYASILLVAARAKDPGPM